MSDNLFDRLEDPFDFSSNDIRRARMGKSGNSLMTAVDRNGVFDTEILFCECSDSPSRDEQLLRMGLFPATFRQIETLFSFSVLDDFLTDNLECKTTAQQYFTKLQSMTSAMFPHYVPVCLLI
jgi:CxC2 like cysteine cluster associated with KDZ transposases